MSERDGAIETLEHRVRAAVASVTDPEIPVLSIVDLGMVNGVAVEPDGSAVVRITPTFVGCPATELISQNIRDAVRAAGVDDVRVELEFDPPWTSARISAAGREKLLAFGLAPPHRGASSADAAPDAAIESNFHRVPCPHCGSTQTDLESIFGPTLCRSIHYCRGCRQSFEHFKPVSAD
ncbi:MAG: 1,2-phenylacetyl-CoA epoxidase subunit PaaD [Phycisphaerae bacterium]